MIAGCAWGEEPIGGLPEVDDVSTENPLTELLADPHAELAFMLRGVPFDPMVGYTDALFPGETLPEFGGEVPVYLSSHGYATLDDDGGEREGVPNHTPFPASLASAYNVKVNLLSGGSWQASAVPGFGAIVIANPDGRHDDLLKMNWELRQVTVWVGRRQWIGPSFKRLGKVFVGTVERVSWNTSQIQLHIRDLRQLFEQEVNPEAYLGFGTAVRFRAVGDKVVVPHHASLEPTDIDGNRVVFFETMLEVPALHNAVLGTKGGSAAWTARLFSDGAVGLFDRNVAHAVSEPGVVQAFKPVRLTFVADTEGLRVLADGVQVAYNAFPYGAPPSTANLILGAAS